MTEESKELVGSLTGLAFVLIIMGACIFGIFKISEYENKRINTQVTEIAEKAYYEGQRDAIHGDIRIKQHKGNYVWTKSPWDSGQKPIFDPK